MPFDHQDETGALPDSVTHSEVLYNFVKPPIHGWALRAAARSDCPSRSTRQSSTEALPAAGSRGPVLARPPAARPASPCRTTSTATTAAGTTPPSSTRHGSSRPPTSPPSSSCSCACSPTWPPNSADADGRRHWTAAPTRCSTALLDELWDGERFRRPRARTGERRGPAPACSTSCPSCWATDLPARGRATALAERIAAHLTPYGLATEPPDSPHYRAGRLLARPDLGAVHRAHRGRPAPRRPRTSSPTTSAPASAPCARSPASPRTSTPSPAPGLRDRAYTWTASAYLILAGQYEDRTRSPDAANPMMA